METPQRESQTKLLLKRLLSSQFHYLRTTPRSQTIVGSLTSQNVERAEREKNNKIMSKPSHYTPAEESPLRGMYVKNKALTDIREKNNPSV